MEWERRGFLRLSEGPEGEAVGGAKVAARGTAQGRGAGCGFTRGILALCHATMG